MTNLYRQSSQALSCTHTYFDIQVHLSYAHQQVHLLCFILHVHVHVTYGNTKAHTYRRYTCRYMQVAYISEGHVVGPPPPPPPPFLPPSPWQPRRGHVGSHRTASSSLGPAPIRAQHSWVVLTALLYVGHETRSHQHEEHKRTLHAFNSSSAWYLYRRL